MFLNIIVCIYSLNPFQNWNLFNLLLFTWGNSRFYLYLYTVPFMYGKQARLLWKQNHSKNFPQSYFNPLNNSIDSPYCFNDLGNQTWRFIITSMDNYLLTISELVGFLQSLALEWWVEASFALCILTLPIL